MEVARCAVAAYDPRMEQEEAAVLELSREALRQRLSRARAQLADELARAPASARRTG